MSEDLSFVTVMVTQWTDSRNGSFVTDISESGADRFIMPRYTFCNGMILGFVIGFVTEGDS